MHHVPAFDPDLYRTSPHPSERRSALSRLQALWTPLIAVAVAALAVAPGIAKSEPNVVVVQGSTTFNTRLMEPYQAAIEAMAGVRLQIMPNKSLNGLMALLEGRGDLAMISAPLDAELAALRARDPRLALDRLKEHHIANTRVAFALHPSNPVRKASLDMLRRILVGEVTSWRDLGGQDLPIRVAYVAKAGGVTQTVQSHLLNGNPISAAQPIALMTPEQVIKVVEQEPGAVGLAQIRLVTARKLPELATDETIDQLLLLVSLGEPTAHVQAVIEATRVIAQQRLAATRH